jgi:uncharacterized protein
MIGHDPGNELFAASAAVDALVICAIALWAVRRRPSPWRLLATAILTAGALAAKGVAMVSAGLDIPFGVMHVVWLDAVVVAPLAAAVVGGIAWRSGGPLLRMAVALGLVLAPVGAYASFVEPARLVTERSTLRLPSERLGDDPIRVAVVADLQFEELGSHEREAIDRVMAERPHLILLAGDYHQGTRSSFDRQRPELRRLLSRLRAPGGVFAVQGDSESVSKAREVFAGTGIRLLVDATAHTRVGDRSVSIAGQRLAYWRHDAAAVGRRLENAPGSGDVRLLLAHRPDTALRIGRGSRLDLVVSGHTHGGQLQLPFFGPPSTASDVPRDVAAGGLHRIRGNAIYVSRGIGVERGQAPRLRLGAPPEISILELR